MLGELVDGTPPRDAIHVAITPAIVDTNLKPGTRVGVINMTAGIPLVGMIQSNQIGIIDPFLPDYVPRGERCWVLLFPNTIIGMHHEWQHPLLVNDQIRESSKKWIENFCAEELLDYQQLLDATENYLENGRNWNVGHSGYEFKDEYWLHYMIVTGKFVPENERYSFFYCSC